jgi:hypothetical protein
MVIKKVVKLSEYFPYLETTLSLWKLNYERRLTERYFLTEDKNGRLNTKVVGDMVSGEKDFYKRSTELHKTNLRKKKERENENV